MKPAPCGKLSVTYGAPSSTVVPSLDTDTEEPAPSVSPADSDGTSVADCLNPEPVAVNTAAAP